MAVPSRTLMRLVSAATFAVLAVAGTTESGTASLLQTKLVAETMESDDVSLLQTKLAVEEFPSGPHVGASHASAEVTAEPAYWPHPRGRPEQYSYTSSGFPGGNLTASLAWTREFPNDILWSTLIDAEKNVYLCSSRSVVKFNPDGRLLWEKRGQQFRPASLMDGAVFVLETDTARLLRLDAETGRVMWDKKMGKRAGPAGNMVEAHDGVVIAGVGLVLGWSPSQGIPASRAAGLNASDGAQLWDFTPDCGFWQLMPLFPGDDTAILMDLCGGLYRVGLHNGTVFWRKPGPPGSFSDGGAILGPDGGTYTCSMPDDSNLTDVVLPGSKGVMRKYRLADGQKLWETETPTPCLNMPAVSHDGRTVFSAVGALTVLDGPYWYLWEKTAPSQRAGFYSQQQALMREQRQRAYWNMSDLRAVVMGLSTETGEVQLQYELEPYGNIVAAGDSERNLAAIVSGRGLIQHCGPPAFSSVTVDSRDHLYFGRNNGKLYIVDPKSGTHSEFDAGDGFMLAGASFAPGMMVIPTCQKLLVFKYKET